LYSDRPILRAQPLVNWGTLLATGTKDGFVSLVTNQGSATFIDVIGSAVDITNNGAIIVDGSSHVNMKLTSCGSSSSVVYKAGTQGDISAPYGCSVTINSGSSTTVTYQEAAAPTTTPAPVATLAPLKADPDTPNFVEGRRDDALHGGSVQRGQADQVQDCRGERRRHYPGKRDDRVIRTSPSLQLRHCRQDQDPRYRGGGGHHSQVDARLWRRPRQQTQCRPQGRRTGRLDRRHCAGDRNLICRGAQHSLDC
jgi:hypothetical protein